MGVDENKKEPLLKTRKRKRKRKRANTFSKTAPGICDLIKYAEVRFNVIMAGFFYFAANFNYYGSGFAL